MLNQLTQEMSSIVNATLGNSYTYNREDGTIIENVNIIINRNNPVTDELNNLIGYETIASIEKSVITERPDSRDNFTDADGKIFRIGQVTQETTSKWYVNIREF